MLLRHAIGYVLRRLRLERGRKEASSEILGVLCRVLDISERELLTEVADEYALQREVVSIRPTAELLAA